VDRTAPAASRSSGGWRHKSISVLLLFVILGRRAIVCVVVGVACTQGGSVQGATLLPLTCRVAAVADSGGGCLSWLGSVYVFDCCLAVARCSWAFVWFVWYVVRMRVVRSRRSCIVEEGHELRGRMPANGDCGQDCTGSDFDRQCAIAQFWRLAA
jgi:hypothetical protein